MKLSLTLAFLAFAVVSFGQDKAIDVSVRSELEAMYETDQAHRRDIIELEKKHGRNSDEVKSAWSKQNAIDAQNIRRLEEIIAQYGWPGTKQFGDKAANAAFLVLQHSDLTFQKRYLPLVREAAANGEMPNSRLALLEDRVRLREGGKQLYGSQVRMTDNGEWEPLPLEDEENVDARRASVGLGPLWEYLQRFASRSGGKVSPKWERKNPESSQSPVPNAESGGSAGESPAPESSSSPAPRP